MLGVSLPFTHVHALPLSVAWRLAVHDLLFNGRCLLSNCRVSRCLVVCHGSMAEVVERDVSFWARVDLLRGLSLALAAEGG